MSSEEILFSMTNLNQKPVKLSILTADNRIVNGFMELYSNSLRELALDGLLIQQQ